MLKLITMLLATITLNACCGRAFDDTDHFDASIAGDIQIDKNVSSDVLESDTTIDIDYQLNTYSKPISEYNSKIVYKKQCRDRECPLPGKHVCKLVTIEKSTICACELEEGIYLCN